MIINKISRLKRKLFYLPLGVIHYLIGRFAVSDERISARLKKFFPTYTSTVNELINQLNMFIGIPKIYKLQSLHIEPTNICNLKCLHCTPQNLREFKKGMMDFILFKRIIDELPDLRVIVLSWNGEPLLHKRFFEMCRYATDKNIRVVVYTNGTFLDENNIKQVFSSGISEIDVSIDGIGDAYERNRGFSYQVVKRNLENLLEARNRLGSSLVVLLTATNLPKGDFYKQEVIEEWGGKVDYIHFAHIMGQNSELRGKPCKTIFRHAAISWDGKVSPCVVDVQQSMLYGEIKGDNKIMDIVNGQEARHYRLKHIRGQFDGVCKYCNNFYG